ncbi:MAG: SEC-C metal-binding domain-containing protein, partial [Candidatus Dormibacteria bacterium]
YCHGRHKSEWELEALWERLRFIFPFPPAEEVELEQLGSTPEEVADTLIQEAERLYTEREEQYTPEVVRQVEVQLMLGLIDERWADYLTTLEHLKDDIRWQSLGQRDPLVEFKAEAFSAFQAFQESLKQEIVRYLFHSQIQVQPMAPQPLEGVATHPDAAPALAVDSQPGGAEPGSQLYPSSGIVGPATTQTSAAAVVASAGAALRSGQAVPVVGRNALCPCGSGRKYKRCHGATGRPVP